MFARRHALKAAFCLISLVALPMPGYSSEPPSSELVVYLTSNSGTGSVQPQRSIDYMKLEVGRLMAMAGYRVTWRDARSSGRETINGALALVELRGLCGISTGSPLRDAGPMKSNSFATTSVSEGRVLPFSAVHCDNLTTALAGPLATEPGSRRDYLYGRAMARVLAHELYHVLLRTVDHAHSGIARTSFNATDLLTERFDFETTTLAKLRGHSENSAQAESETASGR